ncbi:MAG: hypothetical protein U1A77_24610 [Pirellulales bacterium]
MDHDQSQSRSVRESRGNSVSDLHNDPAEREGHARFREAKRLTRKRRYVKMALLLLVPALIVWLAPAIVAHTPLFHSLLERSTAQLDGRVTARSASFGWLSPVRLYDIQVVDGEGESLLRVDSVATQRTLLGLLLHSRDPGVVQIEKPVGRLVLRPNGSNWEDFLAPLMEGPSSSSQPIPVTITVTEGSIELIDAQTDRVWTIDRISSDVIVPSGDTPIEATLRGDIAVADGSPGTVDMKVEMLNDAETSRGRVALKTDGLPLDVLGPALERFAGPIQSSGTVAFEGEYAWGGGIGRSSNAKTARVRNRKSDDESAEGDDGALAASGHQLTIRSLVAHNVAVKAAAWIGKDELKIPELNATGSVGLTGETIDLRDLIVRSNVATLEARGAFPLDALGDATNPERLLSMLGDQEVSLHGELDLAQLAQLFPEMLHVREGTEITSGKLVADLESKRVGQRQQILGKVSSSNLTALNGGKQVTWEQPVLINLEATTGAAGILIEKIEVESTFLQAAAKGTAADGRVAFQGDLNRLAEELAQFVDLSKTRLAGKVRGDVQWTIANQNRATAHGELGFTDFELVLGQARPWHEPSLDCVFDAQATMQGSRIDTVHNAVLKVTAGEDQLDVALTQPVSSPSINSTWPVSGRLRGDLARWLPRVQTFLPMSGWHLAGNADLRMDAKYSNERVEFANAKFDFQNLEVVGAGLFIAEPQVQVECSGAWDRVANQWKLPSLTFASSAIAFRADAIDWTATEQGGSLAANVGLRSDLARLSNWIQDPRQPIDWRLSGMTSGQVRLTHREGVSSAQWGLDFENLAYSRTPEAPAATTARAFTAPTAPALETVWTEPQLKWAGKGEFASATGDFKIERSDVAGDGLQVAVAGTIADLSQRCQVALEGEIAYDLSRLVTRLRPHLGPSLQLEGQDTRPFTLRGPIRSLELTTSNTRLTAGSTQPINESPAWPPRDFTAQAGLRWNSANVYGLPIGPGELQSQLKDSVLLFKPIDVTIAEGRFHLAPRIHWDQPEPLIVADAGPIADHVQLSPELCATWLKYVLPVLAEVTEAKGQFSAEFSDAAVLPLHRPEDGEIRGKLDMHGVQVGPSPMTRELISLAQTIKAIADNKTTSTTEPTNPKMWLQLPEQSIPFHWKQRRVYHERLEINLRDVTVLTGGSVGADQTVNLMAEIPIRDEWVARNRLLASLQGQRLQIPILGTLSQPKVDRRAIQNLATQAVTNSANRMLEQELNRGIDRFLKPRQPAQPAAPQQPAAPAPGPAPAPAPSPSPPPGLPGLPGLPGIQFPMTP